MSKKNTESKNRVLGKEELETLATWLKSDGTEALMHIFENKSEVEKIVERMSIIDDKAIREPYTV